MIRPLALVLAIGLSPGLAWADTDKPVDDPDIGRVFMSRAERDELDRLRKLPPPAQITGPTASTTVASEPASQPEGTGYILRSRGEAWLWIDGDFQSVRPADIERSGQSEGIRIIRHEQSVSDQQSVDAGSAESAGAGDADGN